MRLSKIEMRIRYPPLLAVKESEVPNKAFCPQKFIKLMIKCLPNYLPKSKKKTLKNIFNAFILIVLYIQR